MILCRNTKMILTNFMLSWLAVDVNSINGLLHYAVVGNAASVLEVHAASHTGSITHIHKLYSSKNSINIKDNSVMVFWGHLK
jgi:hypothetical protein